MPVDSLKRALGENFRDVRDTLPTKGAYEAIDSRAMAYIVIHHAEGHRTATPEFIANHHVNTLGWEGIGFHFLIRMGVVYYVGDVDTARAHVKGQNRNALGVAITGDYSAAPAHDEDIAALKKLVAGLDDFYGARKEVKAHRDLVEAGSTSCPGDSLTAAIATLRAAPTPTPQPPAPTPKPPEPKPATPAPKPPEPKPSSTKRLVIPYVSQLGPGASYGIGDCGIACVTALGRAFGAQKTVDEVSKLTKLPEGYLGAHIIDDIAGAAKKLGITLRYVSNLNAGHIERELLAHRTVILLVYYPSLIEKFDKSYSQGHFITVHGMDAEHFYYDDPYWPSAREGENKRLKKAALMAAANKTVAFRTPGQALLLVGRTLPEAGVGTRSLDDEPIVWPGDRTLRGKVRDSAGKAIPHASVRLSGSRELLDDRPGVILAPRRGAVEWSRTLTGYEGHRWDCWDKHVRAQTGMSFESFRERVLDFNPHLVDDGFVFVAEKRYILPERSFVVAWSRPLRGVKGSRWQAFQTHVEQQVHGVSAQAFIARSVEENPSLAESGFLFEPERSYAFPENLWGGPEITWTRALSGFAGNRWDAWVSFVRDKVPGLTWEAFAAECLARNPTMRDDSLPLFRRDRNYVLPELTESPRGYVIAWSDERGAFEIEGLRPGRYELEIVAAGRPPERRTLTIGESETVEITLRDVPDATKEQAPVTKPVVEKPKPTPVRVPGIIGREGRNFILNGRPFRFVGANVRGVVHYGDRRLLPHSDAGHRAVQLDAAKRMGARVVRCFLANRHASVEETVARLEATLTDCAARDLYLLPSFTDVHGDTGFNPPGDEQFYTENGMLNRDFYEHGYRGPYLALVDAVTRRFRDHPRLFGWEIGNELKPMAGGVLLPELLITFVDNVGRFIRERDPNHLISTGIINSWSVGCNDEQARRLNALPVVDFLGAHLYEGAPDGDGAWAENQRLEIARAEREAELARALDKPFIVGEIGFLGGDRTQKTRDHLSRWYDQHGCAGVCQWGLMATDNDIGDGDRRFGLDRALNGFDFESLIQTYAQRAADLFR